MYGDGRLVIESSTKPAPWQLYSENMTAPQIQKLMGDLVSMQWKQFKVWQWNILLKYTEKDSYCRTSTCKTGNIHHLWFSSTVKTFDVIVHNFLWIFRKHRINIPISKPIINPLFHTMNRKYLCRINFLYKIQNYAKN